MNKVIKAESNVWKFGRANTEIPKEANEINTNPTRIPNLNISLNMKNIVLRSGPNVGLTLTIKRVFKQQKHPTRANAIENLYSRFSCNR